MAWKRKSEILSNYRHQIDVDFIRRNRFVEWKNKKFSTNKLENKPYFEIRVWIKILEPQKIHNTKYFGYKSQITWPDFPLRGFFAVI